MDHITNDTSLIRPCDMIPVGAQSPRFPVVGHRLSISPSYVRAGEEGAGVYGTASGMTVDVGVTTLNTKWKSTTRN